jgi:hypothetical protein
MSLNSINQLLSVMETSLPFQGGTSFFQYYLEEIRESANSHLVKGKQPGEVIHVRYGSST